MDNEFGFIEKLTEQQIDQLMAMYRNEGWCKDRKREDVLEMLGNCRILVMVRQENGEIAAFARFFSDGVYRAAIYDVITAKTFRGMGCGRMLMERLLQHPMLRGVERAELYCKDFNVQFYEKFGFQRVPEDVNLMWKVR